MDVTAMKITTAWTTVGRRAVIALLAVALSAVALVLPLRAQNLTAPAFKTPEEAVDALVRVVKAGKLDDLIALFGADGRDLAAGSDPATGRKNREVFAAAAAQGIKLADQDPNHKVLIVGNEEWPFPVPLVKDAAGWRFDAAAGKEEVIDRRIGRNELAVIESCHTYVKAQHAYAQQGHDGKPVGLYARALRSEASKQNGLYWPAARGEKKSPLGDLLADAAEAEGSKPAASQPSTFHGYYFKILTAQGAAATGGAKSYLVNGEMSGGFALIAWPAQYDITGIMTFIVNQDGKVYEKDLGAQTETAASAMASYNPDKSWRQVAP
jgi:hypothetical protein